MNDEKTIDSIPIDLFHEIFSRVPMKSIGRCRCVSKQWSSILVRQDFMELFLTKSSTCPRLLIAARKRHNDEWLFYLSPHPHNYNEKSSVIAAEFQAKFLKTTSGFRSGCRVLYASGFFYFSNVLISNNNDEDSVAVICNPLTGSFFMFDPISKEFKVLVINILVNNETVYNILTVGTGIMRWRKIQCPFNHIPTDKGICINGVLYYSAENNVIVCFDVRSEKFRLIDQKYYYHKLINYKGKLGGIMLKYDYDRLMDSMWTTCELHMCVLEDIEKQEWSQYVYCLPETEDRKRLSVIEMTSATSEIALFDFNYTSKPYVYYFSPERKSLHRVEIQVVGDKCVGGYYTFIVDHVEDLGVNDKHLKLSIYDHRIVASFESINKFDTLCRLDDE
ncbi:putative F-box protein At1g30925 [Capsella rubella]|uniref:putative F-box protein At1g30925 n=1 Tax=Capsella rubella TaxID=81985 RepID=UPI000CD56ACF|nr:putative F-box protein At1g30925 [Capsella rubella]